MEVSGDVNDLRQQLLLLLVGLVDWLCFKRKIILDAYCRFTHPSTSIFIRFSSPLDRLARTSAKFIYKGFVADKDELLEVLKEIITLNT